MKLAGFQRGEGGWSSEGSAMGGRDRDSQIVFSLSLSLKSSLVCFVWIWMSWVFCLNWIGSKCNVV